MLEIKKCRKCKEKEVHLERESRCELEFRHKSAHGYRSCCLDKVLCKYCQVILRREKREILKSFFDLCQKANRTHCNRCPKFYDLSDEAGRSVYNPITDEVWGLCLGCTDELIDAETKRISQFMGLY